MSLVMRLNDSSSSKGACQPPCLKPPSVSSSGPPGACMTPSRVQGHEFTDDELAHYVSARLEAIPMKRVLQFEIAVKLSVVYIHHLVWRVRWCSWFERLYP